jgi:hypothetical protein
MFREMASIGILDRFEIEESGGIFRIRWKWPRVIALPLLVFAVGWNAFLVSWYSGVLGDGASPSAMLLFPIPHVVVGLVLPYVALAFLVNCTFIEIEDGELRVRHRPLPFPGKRTIKVADVRQLFCVERKTRKGGISYEVAVRLSSDRETKLLTGLPAERDARFVEQRIESRLGLANRPVYGELPG